MNRAGAAHPADLAAGPGRWGGVLVIEPVAPWEPCAAPCVQSWPDPAGRVCARGFASAGSYVLDWRGIARYMFDAGSSTVRAVPARGADVRQVRDTYDRVVVPLAWQMSGGEALHASAVGWGDGVTLLCAPSGTGKSTFAYGLVRRSHPPFADDGVLIDPRRVPPLAWGAGREARLRRESAQHFGLPAPGPDGRTAAQAGAPLNRSLPVRHIVILDRHGGCGDPEVRALGGGDALAAVLEHAHCVDPTSTVLRRRMVEQYLRVIDAARVWRLSYSSGFDRLEAALRALESALERVA